MKRMNSREWMLGAVAPLGLIVGIAALSSSANSQSQSQPQPQASAAPRPSSASMGPAYLPSGAAPDSVLLVPAPPAVKSGAEKRDKEASKEGLALYGTARWDMATSDADLFTPAATGTFSCAAGVAISAETTPKINQLMKRSMADLAFSTGAAKRKYMRKRPFVVNGKPMCTPSQDAVLRGDGSYPSGHSAIGWGWGLILAEIFPDRAARLVSRGRAFGDSRRVCNVHWLSDVEEGRVVGTAIVARLHAEPGFAADLAAAKAEAQAIARPANVGRDCAKEAATLGLQP